MESIFLIFGGKNDRACYAMARAITRLGERLAIVALTTNDKLLLGSYRKYVVSVRPSPELSLTVLAYHVNLVRQATGITRIILVPTSEYFSTFLLEHRQLIETELGCVIPLPPIDVYSQLTNKQTATKFFADHGIDVPQELTDIESMKMPFVAKPKKNIVSGLSLYPVLVKSEEDMVKLRSASCLDFYFFQKFVIGRSYYILAYVARDHSVFLGSQENLAQQPYGKSVVLAIASDFHRSDTSKRVLQAIAEIGFHGLVMLEFIVQGEQTLFIELNPRAWGPLNLCLDNQSNILEAFIGDWAYGDAYRFSPDRSDSSAKPRYLWLGGIIQSLRQHGMIDHKGIGVSGVVFQVLQSLFSDVYFRRDSWRVFLREFAE